MVDLLVAGVHALSGENQARDGTSQHSSEYCFCRATLEKRADTRPIRDAAKLVDYLSFVSNLMWQHREKSPSPLNALLICDPIRVYLSNHRAG
jgi:hypothetical protein